MNTHEIKLSSNTLIKCVKHYDHLLSIFNDGILPRWNLEDFSFLSDSNKDSLRMGFPMVCFSDIPLSKLKDHYEEYGEYAIGLTKEWGMKNGINPVMYLSSKDSLVNKYYIKMINSIFSKSGTHPLEYKKFERINLIKGLRYLKPYQGSQNGKDRLFYDEKEWRYMPDTENESEIFCPESLFDNSNRLISEKKNKVLKKYALNFELEDIKYVILPNDLEVEKFYTYLKSDRKYKANYVKIIRKIITAEEIKVDF